MKIQTAKISYEAEGAPSVPGYLAWPEDEGPYPAVVVIQEWWGLNDHIQDVVRRFAAEGFVALAPDLYRGQIALEPDEARKFAMELEHPRARADIQGAIDYLRLHPDVRPKSVAVIGFCMGGGLAALMAREGAYVGAVAVFYGRLGITPENVAEIQAPLIGIFGSLDQGFPVDGLEATRTLLLDAGKTSEIHIYEGAPHAFFNDTRSSYRETAADDAWQRSLAWFRQHLTT